MYMCTNIYTPEERKHIQRFGKTDVDKGNGTFLPNQLCFSFKFNSEPSRNPIFLICSVKNTEALFRLSLYIILQHTFQKKPHCTVGNVYVKGTDPSAVLHAKLN